MSASSLVTVLTPIYLNVQERWDYFTLTMESFYRCSQYPGPLAHHLVDDRSPLFRSEIQSFCSARGLTLLGRTEESTRRGFFDVIATLVNSVDTPYCLYLEPDHYFYLRYDFITPILALFKALPVLHQVYLRTPLYYEPFQRLDHHTLVTSDGTPLRRVPIDEENTGWVGVGTIHETFSLMPSLFSTTILRSYLAGRYFEGGPAEVEAAIAADWAKRALVAYLNGQAFCYHIGKAGKSGPGGYLLPGDTQYEAVWSKKQL